MTEFIHSIIQHIFFWPRCAACGILIPQPRIEPGQWKHKSSNHWTAREFPVFQFRDPRGEESFQTHIPFLYKWHTVTFKPNKTWS